MDPHSFSNNLQLKPPTTLTGTAKEGMNGPPIGLIDVGISENAYLFRVALAGMRKNECQLKCEIQRDGTVCIRGMVTPAGGILRDSSNRFKLKVQQLCPPGPFAMSFKLPGPVDPRLFCPNFRGDGILEGVVMKHTVPVVPADG
ncbi:increased DNA methylation 3 [Jatropha curcas]|uniref:increased DNA methylation 3 n=1 Tax=Jatropha curcas TaxID=180498 RepID=UPI0005FAB377|nr:increased DNA methylation 3 [Jatropha curcas]XP_012073586.1 increased DNA methylation 3 [Jatropha curcas]XP_012073587.1 increased DNA methylation 3 [Jatropha curcas]XP_037493604.1 increased DNA methylation 3 [Jatropha curcas]